MTCCWPLNGSDRTRRPAWDGPPTSDLRCCRLASHPHADRRHDHQGVRQSPTIPCMHAHTANAPRKSAAHTLSIHLILDTYNPLAIVPALPSSRLPRHEPRSAPPPLSLRPPSHLFLSLASRIPFASPRRTSTLCRPRHAAHRPNDQQTFSPHRHLPSFPATWPLTLTHIQPIPPTPPPYPTTAWPDHRPHRSLDSTRL